MSRLCLDTSAYSHFRRGHVPVVELLDTASWVGIPAVVLGELRTGFALGSKRADNEERLLAFLAHPVVHELAVDGEVASIYAEIVVALRRAATPVPTNDIWIAATSARQGATVVTYDEHFSRIQRVGVQLLKRS